MPGFDWQNITALGLILLAAMHLLTRLIAAMRSRSCGGGCSHCPSQTLPEETQPPDLVTIEQLAASADRTRETKLRE